MIYIKSFKEAFRSGYAPTAVEKMANILGRRLGVETIVADLPLDYINKYGKFTGYLVSVGDTQSVRFNFDLGKSDRIVSIDVWNDISEFPDYTVEIDRNDNVVNILNTVEALLNGEPLEESFKVKRWEAQRGRKSFVGDVFQDWVNSDPRTIEDILVNERLSSVYNDFLDWVDRYGKPTMSKIAFIKQAKQWLNQNNLANKFTKEGRVKQGVSDTLIVSKDEDKEFRDILKMNYKEKFDMLEQYVDMIINGYINSLFVYGTSGSGKTYTVKKVLDRENANYTSFSGGVKGTRELVKILYDHRDNEILLFDDFDSAMKNKEQLNILKTALQDEKVRTITYVDLSKRPKKDKIPSTFDFTSGIIFISNLRRIDPAIRSRSMTVDLNLNADEMIDRIKDSLKDFMPKIPLEIKEEVLEFLIQHQKDIKRIDFRQFKFSVANRLARPKGDTWKKWTLENLSR